MPRRKSAAAEQLGLLEARVRTAPCVPAIRVAVEEWRSKGYKGATETTRRLLSYWFHTDHRLPNGAHFRYHHFQREAIETIIYLYEVVQVRSHKDSPAGASSAPTRSSRRICRSSGTSTSTCAERASGPARRGRST